MSDSSNPDLECLGEKALEADVFSSVELQKDLDRLICRARGPESEAYYQADWTSRGWVVGLLTPDRWLSESIEAELVHTGDSMEELLEEELIDMGIDPEPIKIDHFRSDSMLYTFQTTLPESSDCTTASTWLLAFEATFRVLGDMTAEEED